LSLSDAHWDADIGRLVDASACPGGAASGPGALGGAAVAASAVRGAVLDTLGAGRPRRPAARRLAGRVKYGWGAKHDERFDVKRHAGQLTGTATFLSHPRAIDKLEFDGSNLRFETHTQQSMGNRDAPRLKHRYSAELRGQPPDERLALRMQTSGAFQSTPPLEFEARRVAPAVAASSAAR